MSTQIFIEENKHYQIDFSSALWATDKMHTIYAQLPLKDVDWLVETKEGMLLVEYKNSNIHNAQNPEAFDKKIQTDKHYIDMAHKFYDSLLFIIINNKSLINMKFVYILESEKSDSTTHNHIRNKISKHLPLKLQEKDPNKILSSFEVLSIQQWNEAYPNFILSPVQNNDMD